MTRNVLHINSNYLTSKLHENLVDRLTTENFRHTIFMPVKEQTVSEFLYESKHDIHAPVTFKNRDKFIFTYKQRKIIKHLEQTVDLKTMNLIHAHTMFTDGNTARKMSLKYNIPYIVTVRGMTDIDGFVKKRFNLRWLGRRILEDAQAIIFLSESNKAQLFEKYYSQENKNLINKSHVLPNGIDEFWHEKEYHPKKLSDENVLKLLYVGKLKKEKNAPQVLKVMRVLRNKYSIKTEATFIGETVDESIYNKLKQETDLSVKLVDRVDKEMLIQYYRSHDIFIMPSFTETFGLVYAEAMSQGLPVIYTKDQGFDNQFPDGTVGYSTIPTDTENIAEKVLCIKNDYEKMSENAVKNYKKFDWDRISQGFLEIYKQTVDKV